MSSLDSSETKRLVDPYSSDKFFSFDRRYTWFKYAPPGYLLYVRQDRLLARPFDARSLQFTGDLLPVPLGLEGQLWTFPWVSENGTLCYGGNMEPDSNINTPQVKKFDRRGKEIEIIGPPGNYFDMDLSRDGTRLALEEPRPTNTEGDIWILDLHRGIKTRFTEPASKTWNYCPRWSPDESRILFSSSRDGSSEQPDSSYGNLYLKASSGEGIEEALLKSKQMKYLLDWSRDGCYVLYESQIQTPEQESELWALPLLGDRKPFLFLQSAGHARLSPDGRWVAYVSPEQVSPDETVSNLYVRSFPSGEGKWRITSKGGYHPQWRGDGKELFYNTFVNLAEEKDLYLMSVEVKPGSTFQLGPPRALFENANLSPINGPDQYSYAVSPDGQYFYILVRQPPSSAQIHVVLNWTADLPRK